MKPWIVFIAFSAFVSTAHAQVNKCVDAAGKTVYSQGACPKGTKASRISAPPPVSAGAAAKSGDAAKGGGPKTAAELEQEFRKRQQEQAEARKKEDEAL